MATAALSNESAPRIVAVARRDPARGGMRIPMRVVIASVATALVVAGWIAAAPPIVAISGARSALPYAASLQLPGAYLALAPLCGILDALTLLTPGQHLSIFLWTLLGFAGWRIWRRRGERRSRTPTLLALHDGRALALLLLVYWSVYAFGLLAPRPMAALSLHDRDALAVDVHSHTDASHDGRGGFDAEANRRWHAAAGFAAAYLTDHRGYAGAELGALRNPARAGDGTVLLPGIESALPGAHVMLLGARRSMGLDRDGALDLPRLGTTPGIVTVLAFPARLSTVPADLPLTAVEGSDGAPRGLRFTRRHVEQIRDYAAARGLTEVAGSNNHGWGRTAAAWTVLRIPGWRAMSAGALDSAIRATLLRGAGVSVLLRSTVAPPTSNESWIATPFLVAWDGDRRLAPAERAAWVAWIWGVAAIPPRRRRRVALPNASSVAARGRRSRSPARSAPLPGR